jgi:hypothetical protein
MQKKVHESQERFFFAVECVAKLINGVSVNTAFSFITQLNYF